MNLLATGGCAVAGAIAGVPLAALAYGVRPDGPVRIPPRWWTGDPASRLAILAVSTLCAGAGAAIGAVAPANAALPAFWFFAVVGVPLAIIDLRCRRLPYLLTGSAAGVSELCFTIAVMTGTRADAMVRAVLTGLIAVAVLLIVALAMPGQLGLGDITFSGAIALNLGWVSWQAAFYGVACGWLLQSAIMLATRSMCRSRRDCPMGPALILGWMLTVTLVG
jgi:leader peptidase (prepilin peptidase)/N-methyltransferase